jgi:Skp family chaperone for outer membrane proteins
MASLIRSRNTLTLTVAAMACAFAAASFAIQQPAAATAKSAATPTAIAFVDLGELLEGLDERAVLEQRLERTIAEKQANLQELQDRFKTAQELLEVEQPGTETHRRMVIELYELEAAFKVRQEALTTVISLEKGTTLSNLYRKIITASESLAVRDGWDAILIDDSKMPLSDRPAEREALQAILSRHVIYAAPKISVTDTLRQQMNNAYQAGQ